MPVQSAIGSRLESPLGTVFEPWYKDPQYIVDGIMPSMIFNPARNQYAKAASPNGPLRPTTFMGLLEGFSRSGDIATRVNAAGVIETVGANVPRFTHDPETLQPLGLLVEEARTNYIRNNKLLGGDVGTNTLPTNVSFGTYTGFTISGRFAGYGDIAGTTGAKYIDLKFTCAASGAVASLAFDISTAIPALQNEVFAASCYVQLIAGDYTNITTEMNVVSRSSGGGFIANESTALFTATSTVSRVHSVGTLTAATTAYTAAGLVVRSTGAGDITLRILLPQHEKVTGVTQLPSSPILTYGSAVTRAQDEAYTTDMTWFNPNEGSFIVLSYTGDGTPLGFGNSVGNNRGQMLDSVTENGFFGIDSVGNSRTARITSGLVYGAKKCTAVTYETNYVGAFANGVNLAELTAAWTAWNISRISLGRRYAATSVYGNQPVSRVLYYPKRLTNSEIQRLTAL